MVIMASGIAHGPVRTTTTESRDIAAITKMRLNYFCGFSVARYGGGMSDKILKWIVP